METFYVDLLAVAGFEDMSICDTCGHHSVWEIYDYYDADGARRVVFDDSLSCYDGVWWDVSWDEFIELKWPELQDEEGQTIIEAIREGFRL